MPDIRITYGTADSLFISTFSSATLHSLFFSLSLARCIILAAGSRRQGGRRSQFADTILPAALRVGFLSRSPFLSVSYPLPRCPCPSLCSGLGRVKILALGVVRLVCIR